MQDELNLPKAHSRAFIKRSREEQPPHAMIGPRTTMKPKDFDMPCTCALYVMCYFASTLGFNVELIVGARGLIGGMRSLFLQDLSSNLYIAQSCGTIEHVVALINNRSRLSASLRSS